jgi:hypothetical protein
MIDILASEWLSILIAFVALSAALLASFASYRSGRKATYDAERNAAQLEALRASYEERMYRLTSEVMRTQERWQDLNHLLISSQQRLPDQEERLKRPPMTQFLRSNGLSESDLKIDEKLVFVLTPFNQTFRDEYDTIQSVCARLGLRCIRGDEDFISGDLLPHIVRNIARARIVIANIEGRNPNVFYELGLAHAMDKVTILVAEVVADLPFDFRTKKMVLYHSKDELRHQLHTELARTLAAT